MTESAFAKYESKIYAHRWSATLLVDCIAGGVPSDPKIAEGWIKTKLQSKDDLLREQVAETMVERGVTADEAASILANEVSVNGFRRDDAGLYIKGYQVKAAIKEAAMVAVNAGHIDGKKWGQTAKGMRGWLPEHVFVVDDRVHLGVTEPTGIAQRFVHTFRGSSIAYEEYVENAKLSFTVESDYPITEAQWAAIWLTGQRNGIGATRSQGYGRYVVTDWTAA
jgi:hypothetical protein